MDAALCPRCDAPTSSGAQRCPSCGASLEDPPGESQPAPPSPQSGSLADPNRPWAPPDSSPRPTTTNHDQGRETPRPRPRTKPRILLTWGAVLVLAAVLAGVVTSGRSHERAPVRPAAAALSTTTAGTTAGDSATAPDALRTPDTLGGVPRAPLAMRLPPVAGGRLIAEFYTSSGNRQVIELIAARPGAMGPPAETASFMVNNPIDGSSGTFSPYPRDDLEIRCADRKRPNGEVVTTVCYLDWPDLQVIVNAFGMPSARIPDLVAEAYQELKA